MHDVDSLECYLGSLPPGGLELVFWSTAPQGFTRHRDPIFGAKTGLGPQDLCIDEMHTMHLGVFQAYAATVSWQMLRNDVYHRCHGLPEGAVIEHGVCRLRFELDGGIRRPENMQTGPCIYCKILVCTC